MAFPEKARHEAGYQLMQVQAGGDPDDWRPMKNGLGVKEIRKIGTLLHMLICECNL